VGDTGHVLQSPREVHTEALEPIVKFKRYKAFEHITTREFYSLLREAMRGARGVNLLWNLINEQTLPGIMSRVPRGTGSSVLRRGPS
jgi:hypothetical protein